MPDQHLLERRDATERRAGFGKRLMFGSDQMVWADAIGLAVENVESAPFLSEAQKRDVFHDNAVRFFRFDTAK